MRTALLAAYRTSSQGALSASLLLAGRSVLAWQVTLAQALGCGRVIVLSDATDEALAEAESECRAKGLAFHRLHAFTGLAALLHAEDELLLVGDGILPDRQALARIFAPQGPGNPLAKAVLCLPSDDPQAARWPADFERIDAGRCWAGATVMRAAPVQRLGDFPPDANAISLLLRLALQAGTPCRTLEPDERTPGKWLLAHSAEALIAEEQALIARHSTQAKWSAPGLALADWAAARLVRRGPAKADAAASLGGLVALIAAIAGAAAGWVVVPLAAALLGSAALDLWASRDRLRRALLGGERPEIPARLHDPGRDGLAAAALFALLGGGATGALAPLAIGAARLAARTARNPAAAAFWHDRTAQLAMMLAAAPLGWLPETTALLALAAMAQALFEKPAQSFPE